MRRNNIVLTGFMGTGKTTVGRMLAERLGYAFMDTDDIIQERAGRSIPEIFQDRGEAAFREMEAAVAQELADKEGLVIATGGRMMLDPANAAALSRKGRVFCLAATPEEITDRVTRDDAVRRPLLEVDDPTGRIMELLREREAGYGRFQEMVTSGRTPEEVTQSLLGLYHANPDMRIPVTAPDSRYEMFVGAGLLPFSTQLAGITGPAAILTDTTIGPLYGADCGPAEALIAIPSGQRHKTLPTVQYICEQLVEKGLPRNGTLIGLGGNDINGLTAFVAAIYMRGIDCVHCPTTLLAMIDTSIGGKAGINLPQGKNLVGVFKQPRAVIADVATLHSLSPSEFAGGMAEVIKHGLIGDSDLLSMIETGRWRLESRSLIPPLTDLKTLVARAVQVKIRLVEADPYDKGPRNVLNLGHTFAHAIEQASAHRIAHGDAVAMGLVAAVHLSARIHDRDAGLQSRVESIIENVGLPVRIPRHLNPDLVIKAMDRDKKKIAGRQRFVLLRDIGDAYVSDAVDPWDVMSTLHALTA